MSLDRFLNIMKFFRFGPFLNGRGNIDPKTRLDEFLDTARENCQIVMRPGKHIAIDEALVLWKGRLGFRQFMKTKRARFGIKLFLLCPSSIEWNGYSWNFCIYYGKDRYDIEDPRASAVSV